MEVLVAGFHLRVGAASRCRRSAATEDFVRPIGVDRKAIAIVNAFECGWSVAFPEGSKWFLDQLAALTREGNAEPLAEARARFIRFAEEHTAPEEDVAGRPGVSYTVAEIDGDRISVRWLGGDVALLVHALGQTQVTTPHIIKTEFERKGADVSSAPNPQILTVLTRCFGPDSPDISDVTLSEPWVARAGDVLILMSNQAFHALGHDAVAFLCATVVDPQQLADELVERAFAGDLFYAAVHVTRFESLDVPDEIRRAISKYDPPARLPQAADYARAYEILPLSWDPGGMLAVRPSGSVVMASWDEIDSSREPVSLDLRMHYPRIGALWRLAREVGSLEQLRPRFSVTAPACPRCDDFRDDKGIRPDGCPFCAYTGFTLPQLPSILEGSAGRAVPPPDMGGTAERAVRRSSWWKFWR